jgi:hypothetical protein
MIYDVSNLFFIISENSVEEEKWMKSNSQLQKTPNHIARQFIRFAKSKDGERKKKKILCDSWARGYNPKFE